MAAYEIAKLTQDTRIAQLTARSKLYSPFIIGWPASLSRGVIAANIGLCRNWRYLTTTAGHLISTSVGQTFDVTL